MRGDDHPLGIIRNTSHGSSYTLKGANPADGGKLIKCDNEADAPWQLAVGANYPQGASLGTQATGAVAKGTIGNGGATVNVEFDCKPDTTLGLPGSSIDLDVSWSPQITLTAGNLFIFEQPVSANLPVELRVNAVASLGVPSRGSATRTYLVDTTIGAGGPFRLPIPPFADQLAVLMPTDAAYADITTLTFASGRPIVQYTGAQLLALKNAGQLVPVPGTAVTANLVLAAGGNLLYLSYILSL